MNIDRLMMGFTVLLCCGVVYGIGACIWAFAISESHYGTVKRAKQTTTYTVVNNYAFPATSCDITLSDGWTCYLGHDCDVERGDSQEFGSCWPPADK